MEGSELGRLLEEIGHRLFARNIRGYLGGTLNRAAWKTPLKGHQSISGISITVLLFFAMRRS